MSSTTVVVHPLVLLSVVDHYMRVAKDIRDKRVVGVLLGSRTRNVVDVTNSFAVPFDEDVRNPAVWFLDHNYLDAMYWMFKKVNNREDIVGFYSTGPKIRGNDLHVNDLFRRFCPDPVFVIIDVRPGVEGLPTIAYETAEEVESEGKEIQRVFRHIPCSIGADESEEVGVEHLLRDINDPTTSTLARQIQQQVRGLIGLVSRLGEIQEYLNLVVSGRVPINNSIIYNLQDVFNLMPNLNVESLVRSLLIKTNDMHLVMYITSLVRSVLALHQLLMNKIKYADVDDVLDRSAGVDAQAGAKEKEEKSGDKDGKGAGGEGDAKVAGGDGGAAESKP